MLIARYHMTTHLKNNDSAAFVTSRQKITVVIKLHARNHISIGDVVVQRTFDL